MSRRSIVLAFLMVAALTVLQPLPAMAATTYFVDIGDLACDDTTSDSTTVPYCTIPAAIDDAVDGDTIEVAAGTYTHTVPSVVFLTEDLTINGAGQGLTILDGETERVGVGVSGAIVTLTNLTIVNGETAGSGGNVVLSGAGAELHLVDVTLESGKAANGGGVAILSGTTAVMVEVTLSGNEATNGIGVGGGGAIYLGAAGVLTVTDSTFTSNTSVGHGGGIQALGTGNVTIEGSTFTGNSTSTGQGGALVFHSAGSTLEVNSSVFSGNDSVIAGGAVATEGGSSLTITSSLFVGNTTDGEGGGLMHDAVDNLVVTNTTFFDNDAGTNGGGARADAFFINVTFANNTAGGNGGGLSRAVNRPNVANSIFTGNTAVGLGEDCYQMTSEGHNLISDATDCVLDGDTTGNVTGIDPFLLPLANNSGATMTMALPLGSPARNAGNPDASDPFDWDAAGDAGTGNWSCAGEDQREKTRTDGRCDIGAYELDRVIRYAGANRYATAAAISAGRFPGGASTVFIATGLNFPDALAGAAVANRVGAPLLLVNSTEVPTATVDELTRLDPDTIVILGGIGSVPTSVETTLATFATTIERKSGADRYETAVAISQGGFVTDGSADVVFIATGLNFPDALAAGPAASILNGPVLLVPGSSLPTSVADEIVRLTPDVIVVVGGSAAVTDGVLASLEALQLGDTVIRISGANRYATAVAISDYAFTTGADLAFIATGLNFPDALAGAAAALDSPILLVPGTEAAVPQIVEDELVALGSAADGNAVILGGTVVVTASIETDLNTIFAL